MNKTVVANIETMGKKNIYEPPPNIGFQNQNLFVNPKLNVRLLHWVLMKNCIWIKQWKLMESQSSVLWQKLLIKSD